MQTANSATALDELIGQLSECLTPESARRLVAMQASPKLQARVDDLASRHSRGMLTPEEQTEYSRYVDFDTLVAILKSKARQLLAATAGD